MAPVERLRAHQATSEQAVALLLAMRELTLRSRIARLESMEPDAIGVGLRGQAFEQYVVALIPDVLAYRAPADDDVPPFALRQRGEADLVPFALDQVQLGEVIDVAAACMHFRLVLRDALAALLGPGAVV